MNNKILDIGYIPPEKKTILVIDDESTLQSLILDTFAEDFKIISAHNGKEGLERAEADFPDLILLDVMMPDINGFEVLERLRGNAATRDIPVLVITARGFDQALVAMLKLEPSVAGFLTKPFHVADLRQIVHASVRKKA